jgi:16S rRNA (cytosine1402-N4)-methyltransferase
MTKGEEKINLFKSWNKKAISPSENEIKENPPSRSAKLRYVVKKEDFYDFETDILQKFDHLIKIENFSNKLWRKQYSQLLSY